MVNYVEECDTVVHPNLTYQHSDFKTQIG